jgi:hypothetical protein
MLPTRIRTILLINVVLAVGFTAVQSLSKDVYLRQLLGLLISFTVIMAVPLILVEQYLFARQRGWWYHFRRDRRPGFRHDPRRSDRPPYPRTKPTDGEISPHAAKSQTRLFETSTDGDAVSRASIMRTVAARLEAEGKSEAAKRCLELIAERYGKNAAS